MAIPEIDVERLAAALDGGAPLFDVRQPDEYVEGHVPGAVLVPLGDVAARAGEFPRDTTTYVICRSGARSLKAAEFLSTQGVQAVNVAGGTLAWIASGRDVVEGEAPGAGARPA